MQTTIVLRRDDFAMQHTFAMKCALTLRRVDPRRL